jgi:hypothetical protein
MKALRYAQPPSRSRWWDIKLLKLKNLIGAPNLWRLARAVGLSYNGRRAMAVAALGTATTT